MDEGGTIEEESSLTPPTPSGVDTSPHTSGSGNATRKRPRDDNQIQSAALTDPSSTEMDSSNAGNDGTSNSNNIESLVTKEQIKGLRLEAIFHPKFDNEHREDGTRQQRRNPKADGGGTSPSNQIRDVMMKRLHHQKGYLEVSLKHSGSLVLWSGGERYYSKNSAHNQFTHVAEILLRQHFWRAWSGDFGGIVDETNSGGEKDKDEVVLLHDGDVGSESRYQQCSDYIQQHRLTVAFEVVTAVLGDHGAIPHRDYLIVTAVADRSVEGFLSTRDVLELCQRFRLPHNDVWTFRTPQSATTLFRLYDTSRETGLAHDTVPALTAAADSYVPSMYPHDIFQGDILEGFIIRYVPYSSGSDGGVDSGSNMHVRSAGGVSGECSSTGHNEMTELAAEAERILQQVPPPKSPCFVMLQRIQQAMQEKQQQQPQRPIPPVLMADIRAIIQSIPTIDIEQAKAGKKSSSFAAIESERANIFSDRLYHLLTGSIESGNDDCNRSESLHSQTTPRRTRHDLMKMTGAASSSKVHLPSLVEHLVDSNDNETRRIATLLQTLDSLKGLVTYNMMAMMTTTSVDNENDEQEATADATAATKTKMKMYCMIHVMNDTTFFKFQKVQATDSMTLFRGFCVELLTEEPPPPKECGTTGHDDSVPSATMEIPTADTTETTNVSMDTDEVVGGDDDGDFMDDKMLMLKMKFLPYMVRTFICRNLLKVLIKDFNPQEFIQRATSLLDRWDISPSSQQKWMPFFEGWATYVMAQVKGGGTDDDGSGDHSLGPLTDFSYLCHLEHFTQLYESGEYKTKSIRSSSSNFHGFVCVVAVSPEVASAIARKLAEQLGDVDGAMVTWIGDAAKYNRLHSCISYANLADKSQVIRNFLTKKVVRSSILVLYGSDPDDIDMQSSEPPSSWLALQSKADLQRARGMWKKPWRDHPCGKRILLSTSAVTWEPKDDGATTAVISTTSDEFRQAVSTIEATSKELFETEIRRRTNPSNQSVFLFFPSIPGGGKSSLVDSVDSKLEEMLSSADTITARGVHVREGDVVGKAIWDVVAGLLSHNGQPTIVIADKNTPPPSWQRIGQICCDSNAVPIPVLPDAAMMQTTTIQGSRYPNGTFQESTRHYYPFSLLYLAVCLGRVLNRPANVHVGKLDSGEKSAAMVVVQFYAFYRHLKAEDFVESLRTKIENAGAHFVDVVEPIKLPVVKDPFVNARLPEELERTLTEALQLWHGYEADRKVQNTKDDAQLVAMEKKLRSTMELYWDEIQEMTASLDESRTSFIQQIMDRLETIDKMEITSMGDYSEMNSALAVSGMEGTAKQVRLVSLDVDRSAIHQFLKAHETGALSDFFARIRPTVNQVDVERAVDENGNDNSNEIYPAPDFVAQTHVTMGFAGRTSTARALLSKFRHLQGCQVAVTVTAFLWSSTHAAFEVEVATTTTTTSDDANDGGSSGQGECLAVPPSENPFSHITVWCAPGNQAYLSNQLPQLVASGGAQRVDLGDQNGVSRAEFVGTISFWNHNNQPIQIERL